MAKRELLIWVLAAVLTAIAIGRWAPSPLADDSYQYLNVARNFAHGRGISTSLVHFDSERAHGTIPAPMTTFAPAFPVIIGLLEHVTADGERVARLLDGLCFAALLVLLASFGRLFDLSAAGMRVVFLFLLLNSYYLRSADSVLTEPLFTVVALASLALLGTAVAKNGDWRMFACGHFLIAAAYWIRYAGLFLFMSALVFFLVIRPLLVRGGRRRAEAAWCGLSGFLIGLVMLRNYELTGSWKGGNTKAVSHPLLSVLADYLRAQYHLLFGESLRFDAWKALPLLLFAAAVAILIARMGRAPRPAGIRPQAWPALTYLLVYTAGMIYLGKCSVISFGARMFFPILPLYALGLGWLYTRAGKRAGAGLASVLAGVALLSYSVDNFRDFAVPQPPSQAAVIREDWNRAGGSLRDWMQLHAGRNEPIAAMAGQATGFALERPTLSLIGAHFSDVRWDKPTLTAQMRRFHARYLVLYTRVPDPVREEAPFLAAALRGCAYPGFHLAAGNSEVRIFELDADGTRGKEAPVDYAAPVTAARVLIARP